MNEAFAALAEEIRRYFGNGRIYYLAGHGNYGDALIRKATIEFLERNGINFHEINRKNKLQLLGSMLRRGGLIYGGGGAWHSHYCHAYHDLKKLFPFYKRLMILPSTYGQPYSLPNTLFYRRDQFESRRNIPNALFCHDMAFSLEINSLGKGNGVGNFCRLDAESTGNLPIVPSNRDISLKGNHYSDIAPFIRAIDDCAVIHTDRLHVAIAACLLAKELHFYPNNYFKNRAVYLSSIKGNFPRVTFHG